MRKHHQLHMAIFFWFLLILSNSFTSISAAFASTYYLNSTLPSTWSNNNSLTMNITTTTTDGSHLRPILVTQKKTLGFACGFYSINTTSSSFFFSIALIGAGNPVVVWSANRNQPVGEDARIELSKDGNLVLKDADGSDVWATNTTGKSVSGMNMTESGNLVLFDKNGNVIWQSFDSPTDTLLAGQRLYEGQKLFSSSSDSNWSQGLYYATLGMTSGFSAYTLVPGGLPQMYYQLKPMLRSSVGDAALRGRCRLLMNENVTSNDGANYPELQSGGFMVNLGYLLASSRSDSLVEYVKITSDGHLKLYRYGNGTRTEEVTDMVTRDLGECQHPRSCGDYGICKDGQCSCPGGPYFGPARAQGCARTVPLSCKTSEERLVEVKNGSYFNLIETDTTVPNITDVEGCKRACQARCSCEAAFFKYERNTSKGSCYIPSNVLSIREGGIPGYNFSSAAFIKVDVVPKEGNNDPFPPKRGRKHLAGIIAGVLIATLVLISIVLWCVVKRRKAKADEERTYIRQVPGMPVRFSFKELQTATSNFRERLGGGGFGTVYKGTMLDGTLIAVKMLDKVGQSMKEFLAEVDTIGSIHHFNLVRLIGFCAEKSSCLLVYEFMFNGSLENWIYSDQRHVLDWEKRKKIVLDIAKGLAYLHEECRQRIIHLDIKPQNILLDEQFNAKISDFGLSKLVDRDDSQVLTTMRGTPGYIAPECGNSNITVKVDIYSFGIVLLEIVAGRRNLDTTKSESSKHLLYLLQKKAVENEILDIVENLEEEVEEVRVEMERMIRIAAWCLQNDPTKRPLMSTVVKVLEGVMEVNPDIKFRFIYAMTAQSASTPAVSAAPQASVLSNPR